MTTLEQPKPADESRDSVPRSGAVSSCNDLLSVRLTHLDLFSGIGGFALAAQAAGFTTIGFSEIEPYACKILKRHWPNVPNYGDIRNVRGIRADLITGGFPCQPFSVAGEQRGAKDDRHLWPEMCRVIAEARPTWVLGENVPGIIGMELDNVLSDLESLGYACWPIVVPACAVDARHRRDRVWIVAYAERAERRAVLPAGSGARERQVSKGQATDRTEGCGKILADSNETGRREQRRAEPISKEHATSECSREDVGNSMRSGLYGAQAGIYRGEEIPGPRDVNPERPSRWPTEPGMGRVVNGLPNRTHRLKGFGNAIVPQVAETLIREMARTLNDQALLRHDNPESNMRKRLTKLTAAIAVSSSALLGCSQQDETAVIKSPRPMPTNLPPGYVIMCDPTKNAYTFKTPFGAIAPTVKDTRERAMKMAWDWHEWDIANPDPKPKPRYNWQTCEK